MRRRVFLGACLTAPILLPASSQAGLVSSDSASQLTFLSAAQSRLGEHSIIGLNALGEVLVEHAIPSRGHSFAMSKSGHTAVIARRPANFCLILDAQGNLITEMTAIDNRHFYGHGVYDLNSQFLYLTENDFVEKRGVVGVYDVAKNYQRVGEFSSGGLGPHEIMLSTSGEQLIVANGGIETHPETGRKKLNLDSMRPSIAFLNRRDGELLSATPLPAHQHANSIRHIDVSDDNVVYLAMQNQNKNQAKVLLAKIKQGRNTIEKITLPANVEDKLDDYVGDMALDISQQFLAASSPYGNTLIVKSLNDEQVLSEEIMDVCAISKSSIEGEFIVTSGTGSIYRIQCKLDDAGQLTLQQSLISSFQGQQSWDNHLLVKT